MPPKGGPAASESETKEAVIDRASAVRWRCLKPKKSTSLSAFFSSGAGFTSKTVAAAYVDVQAAFALHRTPVLRKTHQEKP